MSDFITLYTDASFQLEKRWARVAFRGKCSMGSIEGSKEITVPSICVAEMQAILFGIEESIRKYPALIGFFVNSDNLGVVRAFWEFRNLKVPRLCEETHAQIKTLIGSRWIRTKHVKAHMPSDNMRSYMNNYVDRMTRGKTQPVR